MVTRPTSSGISLTFQVKPRLLTLLGDQLIRDANLAVFELVKNAYDADASSCSVALEHPEEYFQGEDRRQGQRFRNGRRDPEEYLDGYRD
jgi:anti-sigma regulatory factor (Ser/Thr protein kinase)